MVSNGIDSVADDGWPPDTPPGDSGPHDGPNFPPPKLPEPRPFSPNASLAVSVNKDGNASQIKVIPNEIKMPELEDFSKYTTDDKEIIFLMIRDRLKSIPNLPQDSIDEMFNVDGLKEIFNTAQKVLAPLLFPPDTPAQSANSQTGAQAAGASAEPSSK